VQPLPRETTSSTALTEHLLAAEEVWVTADSISMVFEAVTAGARVGLLPAPVLDRTGGPVRGLEMLVQEGCVTPYAVWLQQGRQLPAARRLHETARCAELVLERLFPEGKR